MASGVADHVLADALLRLRVDASWPPLHQLLAALAVIDGESAHDVGRRTHHLERTIEAWTAHYRGLGRDAFFPLHLGPGRPRGATMAGMLSGRLTEEAWALHTRANLADRYRLVDAREQDPDPGWDFEIAAVSGAEGGFTVDVKLHSEPFREADRYVGLKPEDCVPLGIYKMLVARARQRSGGSHHVYAFLFRPHLADDIVHALSGLPADEQAALELLFQTTAPGRNRQQRRAVASVVDRHLELLLPLIEGHEFRTVSTRRASNLFLELVETRAPMLSGRGSGFGSTINMHYSWASEMTPWAPLLERLEHDGMEPLLNDFFQGRV